MGKVHRIKKSFQKLISQPLKEGNHHVGGVTIYVGKRSHTGEFYLMHLTWSNAYKPLVKKLIEEYEQSRGRSYR